MTKRLTEVRRFNNDDKQPWVVAILKIRTSDGYVVPDGTSRYVNKGHGFYDSKSDAEAAEALYLAKNVGDHNGVETSAGEKKRTCGECEIQPRCGTIDHKDSDSGHCISFKPKTFVNGAKGEIRTFETGATRDTVEGKLDYVRALCPLVLRRYVQYLDKHRLQSDGSMRDFDNWKQGVPRETYHSSKGRHFFADWLLEEGYEVSDNHGVVDEEDALCGELFNAMGKLREILKAKLASKEKE